MGVEIFGSICYLLTRLLLWAWLSPLETTSGNQSTNNQSLGCWSFFACEQPIWMPPWTGWSTMQKVLILSLSVNPESFLEKTKCFNREELVQKSTFFRWSWFTSNLIKSNCRHCYSSVNFWYWRINRQGTFYTHALCLLGSARSLKQM